VSVRLTITTLIGEIAAEQKVNVAPLTDDLVLLDSGLDSLCFAILVARLEDKLGVDPFTAAERSRRRLLPRDLWRLRQGVRTGRRLIGSR
jgi:acyl carrier protein